jgi:hypothetical protein
MRAIRGSFPLGVLTAGLLWATAAAVAQEPAPAAPDPVAPPRRLDREILMELGRPEADPGLDFSWRWFTDGSFRIKGKGLLYRHRFRACDGRKLVLKVEGPRVEDGYGFVIQIEF